MKQVVIDKLEIRHFKGVRNLNIEFEKSTNIHGENGSGKTTIVDAFVWCLFGKDSQFKKEFSITPLDGKNIPIRKLSNEVHLYLFVDGIPVKLSRIRREKWTTPRGANVEVLQGYLTDCFIDDVPKTLGEYNSYIDDILEEKSFMMVTNIAYFNTINWKERREILSEMAGEIDTMEVVNLLGKKQSDVLNMILNSKTSFEDEKKKIAVSKKKSKEELQVIPSQISENELMKPEALNWTFLESQIKEKQELINKCDADILDKSKGVQALITTKNGLLQRIGLLENDIREEADKIKREALKGKEILTEKVADLQAKLSSARAKAINKKEDVDRLIKQKESAIKERDELRAKWHAINAEGIQVDQSKFSCPTCKRAFESNDIEAKTVEMTANFNNDKAKRLADVQKQGGELAPFIEDKEVQIENETEAYEFLKEAEGKALELYNAAKTELDNYQTPDVEQLIYGSNLIRTISAKVKEFKAQIPEIKEADSNDLIAQKAELNTEIKALDKQLNSKDDIIRIEMRISELEKTEKNLANFIAECDQKEFAIDQFMKVKVDMIEKRVNDKFKYVSFKMFNTQLNGGEAETCETLVNGVPYSDLNHAAKINAGLDIINALSEQYKIYAPVFIDNRESVNEIIESESQIINLIVSTDKQLKVS